MSEKCFICDKAKPLMNVAFIEGHQLNACLPCIGTMDSTDMAREVEKWKLKNSKKPEAQ